LEPVPETRETIEELAKYGDTEAATALLQMSRRVLEIVPEIVGLSLAVFDENLTFTLVASNAKVASLDAVQYLDGGPCIDAPHDGETVAFKTEDVLDEHRWQMFQQASAAAGISSTLSLPIMNNDVVLGSVNLYASTPDAFEGHHERLATACGAWAPGAVSNQDLPFRSRLAAARAPQQMRENNAIDVAIGVIAESQRVTVAVAAERLSMAAARAGITEAQAAAAITRILHE
jgi:transcriptional regulator with GAF, ATPase, and Fis domain